MSNRGTAASEENQRVRLTRRLLKEALVDILQRKSLDQVTVSELCAQAQINRTTFYNHYDTPRALFEEIRRDVLAEVGDHLVQARLDGNDSLAKRVEVTCDYLKAHRDKARLIITETKDPQDFESILFDEESLGHVAQLDALNRYDETTRALLATYLASGTYSLIRKWLVEDAPLTPAELGALAESVAMRGWANL